MRSIMRGNMFAVGYSPARVPIQRSKGDGGNAFEFSAIMVQPGQASHSLDGRHKELRQSHWVLFRSDFAPFLSIHECGNEDLLDLLLVVCQKFPTLDVVTSAPQ